MMFDWGVHLIDQIMCMTEGAKLIEINCRYDNITNDEVDDGFKLDLYFDNGLTVRVEVGTNHFIVLPRYYMAGMSGAAKIEGWNSDCDVVMCEQWKEDNVVPVVTAAGLTKTMAPRDVKTTKKYSIPRPTSDVHDFYRNFCAAIDGQETQIVTHEQLMRVMLVMETALQSNALKKSIRFEDNKKDS